MAFRLLEAAQDRWRWINGYEKVALVHTGAIFVDGQLVEQPDQREDKNDGEITARRAA